MHFLCPTLTKEPSSTKLLKSLRLEINNRKFRFIILSYPEYQFYTDGPKCQIPAKMMIRRANGFRVFFILIKLFPRSPVEDCNLILHATNCLPWHSKERIIAVICSPHPISSSYGCIEDRFVINKIHATVCLACA